MRFAFPIQGKTITESHHAKIFAVSLKGIGVDPGKNHDSHQIIYKMASTSSGNESGLCGRLEELLNKMCQKGMFFQD